MIKSFDKKNMAKSRAVCEAMAEAANTGKRVLTERERQTLATWPRFEDGEPVMLGDKYEDNEGHERFASEVYLDIDGLSLVDSEGFPSLYRKGKSVKRPAPKVLDADGVEIKAGDTVWRKGKPTEYKVAIVIDGVVYLTYKTSNGDNSTTTIFARKLTHTRPDSWERLEEDACNSICGYFGKGVSECDGCPANAIAANSDEFECCERAVKLDIIRRAKALAGVEVD